MRGKHLQRLHARFQRRITPARAGKTPECPAAPTRSEDHPRACGENCQHFFMKNHKKGSPPRVRGKHEPEWSQIDFKRITPARAGKTHSASRLFSQPEDHPRACGENRLLYALISCVLGSPPRVRGKQLPLGGKIADGGITPARAGKTSMVVSYRSWGRDHPRACGENRNVQKSKCRKVGSPPRVRGKRGLRRDDVSQLRITPARAGKTHGPIRRRKWLEDHPRACGENKFADMVIVPEKGSPPRVRGKRLE